MKLKLTKYHLLIDCFDYFLYNLTCLGFKIQVQFY